ncbi:MAG TPA: glutamine--fructose-6-phosphate transaminase (isomerizing) [Patescibacteria group bacterium]|jgi:glucosamine--fructose-6-phosphate aminotransferase (isomerizing)|nr:glutamine--fructose-6-phosphate transaminase (isomerizing) [Patescibacteria group bacterium]
MCGIVGYIGNKRVVPVLLDGLRRLEYRGYDSAGIAVVDNGELKIRRSAGKLKDLEDVLRTSPVDGQFGIGHTRWATHGRPTEENAHPHRDCKGRIVVVHNGTIDNYVELKTRLAAAGHKFVTETDTEVIAHLIEESNGGNGVPLEDAMRKVMPQLKGIYALVALTTAEPQKIVAARQGPPLVVGLGDKEYFVASDVPALLQHTRDMFFLDDGEIAVVTESGVRIIDLSGRTVSKEVQRITWDPIMAEKAGFKHFMLKEIYEQPRAIRDTLVGRYSLETGRIYLDEVGISEADFRAFSKVNIVACGTSWHAALVGKFLIEKFARVPVEVDIGSEFRYRDPITGPDTLTVVISQSGETADTLAAQREARAKGSRSLAIVNATGSMMTREADGVIYTHAGPEIGVASTKAFTAQLAALDLLALYLAQSRGRMTPDQIREHLEHLQRIPAQIEAILTKDPEIEDLSREFTNVNDFLFLGRGVNYPIALEGALKLKEISYIHAEGYPAGEMKHGPIALIDEQMPVVALVSDDQVSDKMMVNIEEAKARGGIIIAIASEREAGRSSVIEKADETFLVPRTLDVLAPMLLVVPLQLLAYHIALRRGCDVDQPRNLAKSVTVE